jgi:hypothetical protein
MWQYVVFKERNERNDSDNYLWRKLDDDVSSFGHRQFTTNPLPKIRHAEVYIDRHLIKGMFDIVLNNCRMGQKTRISATQRISSHSQAFFASHLTNDESLGDEPAIEEKKLTRQFTYKVNRENLVRESKRHKSIGTRLTIDSVCDMRKLQSVLVVVGIGMRNKHPCVSMTPAGIDRLSTLNVVDFFVNDHNVEGGQ